MQINVRLIDYDVTVKESVVQNPDDSYTIFINARYSTEQQKISYLHAIGHIINGDFESNEEVTKIEFNAHKCLKI